MIPTQLTSRTQWVVWRYEVKDTGVPCDKDTDGASKIPYDAKTGRKASSTNPATWSDYQTALDASERYTGLGFVFSSDDPFVGIDLDDCIDGEVVAPWAEEIVELMSSYSEVSPSGKGIKVWVEGQIPKSVKTKTIEIYSQSRYFTVTGWHVEGTPEYVRPVNGALQTLWESLQAKPEPRPVVSSRPAGRRYLERWAQHKIDYAVERVGRALDGEKHNERYKMARLLGGLIPHGLATEDQIADALFDANPPKTEAQRSERKTILDGIRAGSSSSLDLPPEPEQPVFDASGYASCPHHHRQLSPAKNGNGWKCRAKDSSTESGWCAFWWDGDGYVPPKAVDPDTGEVIETTDPDILLNAHRSDTGNAECLGALYGDELRYDHTRRKWLVWDESRWAPDEGGAAHRAMIAVVRERFKACETIPDLDQRKKAAAWCIGCESNNKIEASLKVASRLESFSTAIDLYDRDPMVAASHGDTIDLRAVVHRAVRREDFLTMSLGTTYDPNATAPRWVQFMDEIFGGDVELISYIQRAIGYSLTGDTREQKVFLAHGSGNNGKSVFINTMMALLGDYAGNASFETFDAGRRNESTNDLAALRGKRFVTVIETNEGRRLDEARIKSVTGQDPITCRFLYGEYFTYRPTYKIWIAMNHLPVIKGTDRGIWRRIQLIPFTQNFDGREDQTLQSTLEAELPGILQWALAGLRDWHSRGLMPPAAVTNATSSYRQDSDQIGRWMNDSCVVMSNVSMSSAAGYKSYSEWCALNGENAESQTKWGRRLTEKGLTRDRANGGRVWFGIALRSEAAETF